MSDGPTPANKELTQALPGVLPGEVLHYALEPEPRDGLQPPLLVGPPHVAGTSYLFLFPFDIVVESSLAETQSSYVYQLTPDSTHVRLYPPFSNADSPDHRVEQIKLSAVPSPMGVLRPDHNKVRVKDIAISRQFERVANAMRIDLFPPRDTDFAQRIVDQFLGLVREWTLQWWIKRDRRHSESYLRSGFAINEASERLSGVNAFGSLYGFLGLERPLDLQIFRSIRGNLTNGRESRLSRELFLDGIYFHSIGDVRRALLDLAIGAESAVGEQYSKLVAPGGVTKSAVDKVLGDKFERRISLGAEKLFGRSFAVEQPEEYTWVRRLWFARGNIAHGAEPNVRMPEGLRVVTHADVLPIIKAVLELLKWLETLPEGGA